MILLQLLFNCYWFFLKNETTCLFKSVSYHCTAKHMHRELNKSECLTEKIRNYGREGNIFTFPLITLKCNICVTTFWWPQVSHLTHHRADTYCRQCRSVGGSCPRWWGRSRRWTSSESTAGWWLTSPRPHHPQQPAIKNKFGCIYLFS